MNVKQSKIAVIGTIDENHEKVSGQYDRTEIIRDGLVERGCKIDFVNMFSWKKRAIRVLFSICRAFFRNDIIIFLASINGTRVLLGLFTFLKRIKERKVVQIVIGGYRNVTILQNSEWSLNKLKKMDGVFVEVSMMVGEYEQMGISNVIYLPNCKTIKDNQTIFAEKNVKEPYRFCTYSRVVPEKGIEEAIAVVEYLNKKNKREYCTLDIYGTYLPQDEVWFKEIMGKASSAITYKGKIDRCDSMKVLGDYSLMLFPTKHIGEGIPGGVIDCYEAGLPIITKNTSYMKDIVKDAVTGFVYFDEEYSLAEAIERYTEGLCVGEKMKMRQECLKEAQNYKTDKVIEDICTFIEGLQ